MAGLALSFTLVFALSLALVIPAAYREVVRLSPIDPLPLFLPAPPALVGPFKPNSLLRTHLHRIGDGILIKPEDVAVDSHGFLYVSCADGWIRRVHPSTNSIEDWVNLGAGHRPLGLAIGLHEELIVCDPDMGLLNVTRKSIEVLSQEAQGVKFKLTDAAAVAKDGSIYFTDASHKFSLADYMLDLLEARPNGRLLKYDPVQQTTTVLMDHLYFANGVTLSDNEDFLVVCETTIARCQRYWLKGEQSGHAEIFIDNLPAFPDNVKNDGKGRFWIGLILFRPFYLNVIMKYPFLRQLQVVLGLTEHMYKIMNKRALVLVVSEEGVPLTTLADPTGDAIQFVTTAFVVGDDLYLGSFFLNFLGHVKLNATI